MRLHRPTALLLGATLVLGAVATPGIAFADGTTTPGASTAPSATAPSATTTQLTPQQLTADLTKAAAATKAAGKDGWSESVHTAAPDGSASMAWTLVYAVRQGRAYTAISGELTGKMIAVQHAGIYAGTSSVASILGSAAHVKRLLAAVGRPNATWIYTPDPTVDLTDGEFGMADASPAQLLSALIAPTYETVTGAPAKTVAAGGMSTTYAFTVAAAKPKDPDSVAGTITVTLNAGGVMTAFTATSSDEAESGSFAYGKQNILLPTGAQVVSISRLLDGEALLRMKSDARKIAAQTRTQVTKTKHKKSRTVRLIRTKAATLVANANSADGLHVFSRRNIAGGVRVTATNPYTHDKLIFTVKGAGKKAIVRYL